MNKTLVAVAAFATTLASASGAFAVGPPYCGTYATPSITAATGDDSIKCQKTIAKEVGKFVKKMVKTRGKCIGKGDYTACPNAKDDEKVQKAGAKAAQKIAGKCGGFLGGLGSSYSTFPADAVQVGSCAPSQAHGTAEVYLGETHGIGFPTGDFPAVNEDRNDCQTAINKAASKHLPSILKAMNKCLDKNIKAGTPGDLGALCVGSLLPGGHTAPTDVKTAEAITKANDKLVAALDKSCTSLTAEQISDLYGCPGATTEADLDACVQCSALNASFEIVTQQYAETATLVEEGVGNIQAAVDAGSAGDRFLIASGEYTEGVLLPGATCSVGGQACLGDDECGLCSVTVDGCTEDSDCSDVCSGDSDNADAPCTVDGDCTGGNCVAGVNLCSPNVANTCDSDGDDMAFIGCGAATDDRPRVIPPLLSPPDRGFTAIGVDRVLFQALEVTGWEQDGIFVSNAQGSYFRDLFGDGDDLSTPEVDSVSIYAFFPITSDDVVVEGCDVVNVRDAGIYVGQSTNIVTRHNEVYANVTGIEIENSEYADVYGNIAYDNTGGLLSFKLSGPEKQESGFHNFFDNISYRNNTPNFGIPGTTVGSVIPGTGLMIISEDNSTFENNLIDDNDTFGVVILDQEIINILVGPPPLFDPASPDQDSENLQFINNRLALSANGGNSQAGLGNPSGNWVFALVTETLGTCFVGPINTPRVAIHNGPGDDFPVCP